MNAEWLFAFKWTFNSRQCESDSGSDAEGDDMMFQVWVGW